ncbi:MAG: hypothetical protein WBH40_04620 [Ignavibacteriaceae bacterium]|jgi:hypothetical protein
MIKNFSLTVVILFISNIQIFSQACCTVGTSISNGGERSAIPVNSLSTAFTFQHNVLNTAYQTSTEIKDPLNRRSTVTNFNLEIEYGLVEKVSVLLILPYSNRSRETTVTNTETNGTEVITFTGNGFGDIIILGKYEVITPSILSPFGLALGGGAKLPTGSFEEEKNGTRLSIDLQPGTGAADLLLWGHTMYAFPSLSLSFNANFLYRYVGVNLDSYRYGDELLASLNGAYSIADFIAINLQLKGRFADKDYWNGRFLPSTGGTYIDLTPSIIYYEGSFSLRVFTQVPLYRDLQGIQLAVTEMLGTEISYIFSLK